VFRSDLQDSKSRLPKPAIKPSAPCLGLPQLDRSNGCTAREVLQIDGSLRAMADCTGSRESSSFLLAGAIIGLSFHAMTGLVRRHLGPSTSNIWSKRSLLLGEARNRITGAAFGPIPFGHT